MCLLALLNRGLRHGDRSLDIQQNYKSSLAFPHTTTFYQVTTRHWWRLRGTELDFVVESRFEYSFYFMLLCTNPAAYRGKYSTVVESPLENDLLMTSKRSFYLKWNIFDMWDIFRFVWDSCSSPALTPHHPGSAVDLLLLAAKNSDQMAWWHWERLGFRFHNFSQSKDSNLQLVANLLLLHFIMMQLQWKE